MKKTTLTVRVRKALRICLALAICLTTAIITLSFYSAREKKNRESIMQETGSGTVDFHDAFEPYLRASSKTQNTSASDMRIFEAAADSDMHTTPRLSAVFLLLPVFSSLLGLGIALLQNWRGRQSMVWEKTDAIS